MHDPVARGDALFGLDGTQPLDPIPVFPDPLTPSGRDRLEPVRLPPLPTAGAIQEAVAAALADDPLPARPPRWRPPRPVRQQDPRLLGPAGLRGFTLPAAGRPPPRAQAGSPVRSRLSAGWVLMLIIAAVVVFVVLAQLLAGAG